MQTPADFEKWVEGAEGSPQRAARPGRARPCSTRNGCGSCHMFKAAGSTGTVGPDLDNLSADAKKAGKPLPDFIRESIVDPNAYIAPGFPKDVMPANFAQHDPAGPARRARPVPREEEVEVSTAHARTSRTCTRRARRKPHGLPPAARPGLAARRLDDAAVPRASGSAHRARQPLARGLGAALEVGRRSSPSRFLTVMPLGFLAGIGAFDYWIALLLGRADAARGPLRPRRLQLARLLPGQHRPQGDRRPVRRARRSSSS